MGWRRSLIGIYFFGSVQLFFIGIVGEYIGSIHTQVYHRPLVVEKERINFGPSRRIGERGRPDRRPPAIDDTLDVVAGQARS